MQTFHDLSQEEKLKHFGEGEWVYEPDRVIFDHCGIKCTIRRIFAYEQTGEGFGGHLCGYCFLPKGHKWENTSWDEFDIEVHGGITFCEKDEETGQIIIGFDCAHMNDITPSMEVIRNKYDIDPYKPSLELTKALRGKLPPWFTPTYKNLQYVIEECKSMAQQIAEGKSTCDT